MNTYRGIIRAAASAAVLGALALTTLVTPVAQATDPRPCRVRNVTQDTNGRSLKAMVEAAVGGDRLQVRGVCTGDVVIRHDLVLRGMGERRPVLTGRGRQRVVKVRPAATVHLRHLRIEGGYARSGGGVQNQGALTISGSVLHDNAAAPGGFGGGAIFNRGTLTLRRTVVRLNTAASGGGIANDWGNVVLEDSIVRGNVADWQGGGIATHHGVVILSRSTVTHNRAGKSGGGVVSWDGGFVWLDDESSVAGNTPDDCSVFAVC